MIGLFKKGPRSDFIAFDVEYELLDSLGGVRLDLHPRGAGQRLMLRMDGDTEGFGALTLDMLRVLKNQAESGNEDAAAYLAMAQTLLKEDA